MASVTSAATVFIVFMLFPFVWVRAPRGAGARGFVVRRGRRTTLLLYCPVEVPVPTDMFD